MVSLTSWLPSLRLSSTPLTVTNWKALKFCAVKLRLSGETRISSAVPVELSTFTGTVTSPSGALLSRMPRRVAAPDSLTERLVAPSVIPRLSSSVLLRATSCGSRLWYLGSLEVVGSSRTV